MYITLFGDWVDYGTFFCQKFMVVDYRHNRWMMLQEGYNCTNRPSIVTEYCFDPDAAEPIEIYASVYKANYSGFEAYLEDCSLKETELLEGIPCPAWASYCQLV